MTIDLYVITPDEPSDQRLISHVDATLSAGCRYIQYRHKKADQSTRQRQGRLLAEHIDMHYPHVQLIINDDVALAQACQAGLHIGRTDTPLVTARQQMAQHTLIGVTCGQDTQYAQEQQARGASYCAFGAYRPSLTKRDTTPLDLNTILTAHQMGIEQIALIGGIRHEDITALCQYPLRFLCMSHAIFSDPQDIAARTRAALHLLDRSRRGI